MTVPLTGNPPAFQCPTCGKCISAELGQYGLALRNACVHLKEVHQGADKKLVAVFNL